MSTDSLYALRTAAVTGVGAAIASAWLVADDLAQGRLVHIAPQWRAAPLPVYLVYPQARFHPARLRRFLEVIRANAVERVHAAGARGLTVRRREIAFERGVRWRLVARRFSSARGDS